MESILNELYDQVPHSEQELGTISSLYSKKMRDVGMPESKISDIITDFQGLYWLDDDLMRNQPASA